MNRRFAALLCAGFLLRVVVAATPSYPLDRIVFAGWAHVLAARGPLAIYGSDVVPRVDYSPGYLYVLWVIGLAQAALGGGALALRVLLEIVPIASDLAVVVLLYRFARRIASENDALRLAAVVTFAPPLWLDSAGWGQADALPIALAFLALTAAIDARFAGAWPLLCVAVIVKPLAIVIAPVMGVLQARATPISRGLGIAIVVSFAIAYVTTLPFTTAREPIAVLHFLLDRYVGGANKAPFVSESAFTLYPLLTGFNTPDAARLGPISFRLFGELLVVLAIVAATASLAWSLARRRYAGPQDLRILGAACLSLLALFLFATRMHERYLLPALVFGAPLTLVDRPAAFAIACLALTFTINCAFVILGFSGDGHHPITLLIARLCSAANIAAFAALSQRQYHRLTTTQ